MTRIDDVHPRERPYHFAPGHAWFCSQCRCVGNRGERCVSCGCESALFAVHAKFDGRPPQLTEDDQNMLRCWHIAADK